ncbi:hypothetical protein AX16_007064 [Volvariella volvacea WC 439]|nr:hypothetical protein AX16_007064 [Volvariella volvacea WC 439]
MTEDGYNSTWESSDHAESATLFTRPPQRVESLEASTSNPQIKSTTPQPRTSIDSVARSSTSRWRDNPAAALQEKQETLSTIASDVNGLLEPGFDESVLRALCELDCGVPLLLDRIKQGIVSCRETSVFFKKRAAIEEEYGKTLQKLAKATADTYAMNDGKAGSFVQAWQTSMRIHESMAEIRLRFAQRLNEMSEELATLVKEVDKTRKQTKELATRFERALQESESVTEKSKNRLDTTSEELERVLLQKQGESLQEGGQRLSGSGGKRVIGKAVAKGGMLLKGKNLGNLQKQESDVRQRISNASTAYHKSVMDTQSMRQEYFNFQLPKILRALKECADEIDLGTQYHLTRYAFLFESIVLSEGTTLTGSPEDGIGLKAAIEAIDNRADFKTYMQNYAYAHGGQQNRGPRRDGPAEEGFLPPLPSYHGNHTAAVNGLNGVQDKGKPTFGVNLAEQMERDCVEVPPIMQKCCQAVEKYGLTFQGVYRVGGTKSKYESLKARLDKDLDSVDFDATEWSSDISNITSLLKLWLRELPEPLLVPSLQPGFIEAAKIENERLRHIRLHERVNELPDPNYATLKYLMGHLHLVTQNSAKNNMTESNLAIVFAPSLFGQPIPIGPNGAAGDSMADAPHQKQAIETILHHYRDIFVDESESL